MVSWFYFSLYTVLRKVGAWILNLPLSRLCSNASLRIFCLWAPPFSDITNDGIVFLCFKEFHSGLKFLWIQKIDARYQMFGIRDQIIQFWYQFDSQFKKMVRGRRLTIKVFLHTIRKPNHKVSSSLRSTLTRDRVLVQFWGTKQYGCHFCGFQGL